MREIADTLRELTGPDVFDIRIDRLTILQRTWNGGRRGAHGGFVDVVWADLPQIYRAKHLNAREVAESGGTYEMGDIKFGPITPQWDTGAGGTVGGWSLEALHPSAQVNGVDYIFRLEGEHPGDYKLVDMDNFKAFSSYLVLRRTLTAPSPSIPVDDTTGL
jgi:hypothetical protein